MCRGTVKPDVTGFVVAETEDRVMGEEARLSEDRS